MYDYYTTMLNISFVSVLCRFYTQEIKRDYEMEEVELLRGSVIPECTLAKNGAQKLHQLLNRGGDSYVNALGAMTGE